MSEVRRVISIIVENESSVLSRVSGLFSGRGYNIGTLTVAPIPNSKRSRITITTRGDERTLNQITKQLNKLVPVYEVVEHDEMLEKEMILVKFPITESLADLEALCGAYNGTIVDVGINMFIGMVADEPCRVRHFIKATARYNPIEIVRGGVVAIER